MGGNEEIFIATHICFFELPLAFYNGDGRDGLGKYLPNWITQLLAMISKQSK